MTNNGVYIDLADGVSVWRDPEHLNLSREEIIDNIIGSLNGMDGLIKVLWNNHDTISLG